MQKILFLDCDGAINIISPSYITGYYRPDGTVNYFDDHLVQRLNWFIEKSDVNIVISSSWKSDMDDLKIQMEKSGFKYWDKVVGRTPYKQYRGEEIQAWLDEHQEVKCYVVFEDEPLDVCGAKCDLMPKFHVIEINPQLGLTHLDIQNAKLNLESCVRMKELT